MARRVILLVEDSDDVRELIALSLMIEGFDVCEAADGQAALDLLAGLHPDLLLTDLTMPRVDGYELIRHVRESQEFSWLPVIAMSAHGSNQLRRAEGLGANLTLKKPCNPDDLLEAVTVALRPPACKVSPPQPGR